MKRVKIRHPNIARPNHRRAIKLTVVSGGIVMVRQPFWWQWVDSTGVTEARVPLYAMYLLAEEMEERTDEAR